MKILPGDIIICKDPFLCAVYEIKNPIAIVEKIDKKERYPIIIKFLEFEYDLRLDHRTTEDCCEVVNRSLLKELL